MISINPFTLLDPTICIVGGVVLSIVIIEKTLENQGNYDIAENIRNCVKLAFPFAAIGGALILFNKIVGVVL